MIRNTQYSTKTAWIICLVASTAFFDSFFQLNVLNSISPEMIDSFNLKKTGFGLLSSMYLWGIVLFFIPAGILYDHYSEKILITTGVFLSTVLTFLFAIAKNVELAMVVRFLLGMTHALAFIGVIRFPSLWLKKNIELATSVCLTLGLLGGLLSQAPFAELTQSIGWRNAFLIDGVTGLIMTIMLLIFIKPCPDKTPALRIDRKQIATNVLSILKNTSNWLQACYAGFLNLPSILLGSAWGSLVLVNLFHIKKIHATTIIGMIFLGLLIGIMLTGLLANWMQNNKLLMLIGSIVTSILLIILTSLPLHFLGLFILFLLLGFSMSTQVLVYPCVILNNHARVHSTAIGFISIIIMGSGAVFQIIFGYLVTLFNYQLSLILLVITAMISGILILLSRIKINII